MSTPQVRSALARGNGAAVVHGLLAAHLPGYALRELDPRVTALPMLYRAVAGRWLAAADVLHLAPDYGPVPAPAAARRVFTFHSFYLDAELRQQASPLQRLYYRTVLAQALRGALAQADRITVVSHFLAGCVRNLAPRVPVEVIHNGIDTDRFCPLPVTAARPLRVLFVGTPRQRKGFHLLADVAAQLPAGVELAVTAAPDPALAARAGGRLRALGRVPYAQMHTLYQQADILFFPTQREGFGLVVAEAMACGLPVVSTRCSALPELVDEGKGGYLLPPGDVAGMVAALNQLVANPSLRADMGAWNRARALRDFTLPRMLADYAALFGELSRG